MSCDEEEETIEHPLISTHLFNKPSKMILPLLFTSLLHIGKIVAARDDQLMFGNVSRDKIDSQADDQKKKADENEELGRKAHP